MAPPPAVPPPAHADRSSVDSVLELRDRVALVTGGASGIGQGIAAMLARAGATVVIADRDADGARAQAERLRMAGHAANSVVVDLSDEDRIVACVREVVTGFGSPWVLVNNAGVQDRERLIEATASEWDRTHAINARGAFLMTREVARAMIAAGKGGRIVNIASIGLLNPMAVGLSSYSASKGALLALTQNAAFELAEHGITANAVLPGGVRTPGATNASGPSEPGPGWRPGPLGAIEPEDIGAAVLFFASPAARLVTNQRLAVDAGFSLT